MSGIKSMYVDSSACARVKLGESERFRIYSGVEQGYIMSPWLFSIYMDGVVKGGANGDGKEGSELPGRWKRVEIIWPLACR